jgi:hypothetical protein
MEYHPSGAVEQIGNLFLAPRKRTRRALKLFKHYMELEAETTGSWRGEIEDGDVVTSDEEGREQEQEQEQERAEAEESKAEDGQAEETKAEDKDSKAEDKDSKDQADGSDDSIDLDDAGDMSREELYEKAKELNIEGRSSMSKDELAEAVAQHS